MEPGTPGMTIRTLISLIILELRRWCLGQALILKPGLIGTPDLEVDIRTPITLELRGWCLGLMGPP